MPDYLGKDQRTVRGDEEKNDKPIQGSFLGFWNMKIYLCQFNSLCDMHVLRFISPVKDKNYSGLEFHF